MSRISDGRVGVCDTGKDRADDGRVTICDPARKYEGRVSLCDETEKEELSPEDPCYGATQMQVAGTSTPEVGSSYSVTGGKPPYTWSISDGEINSAGGITSLEGACGTGTVTATDSCGNSASIEVRFSSGQWVLSNSEPGPCGEVGGLSCDPGMGECSVYSGGTKTTYRIASGSWRTCVTELACDSCVYLNAIAVNPCTGNDYLVPPACGPNGSVHVISRIDTYSWSCP